MIDPTNDGTRFDVIAKCQWNWISFFDKKTCARNSRYLSSLEVKKAFPSRVVRVALFHRERGWEECWGKKKKKKKKEEEGDRALVSRAQRRRYRDLTRAMQRSSQGARRNWARQTYPHSPPLRCNLRSLSLFSSLASSLHAAFSRSDAVSVLSSTPFLARYLLSRAAVLIPSRSSILTLHSPSLARALRFSLFRARRCFVYSRSFSLRIVKHRWAIAPLLLFLRLLLFFLLLLGILLCDPRCVIWRVNWFRTPDLLAASFIPAISLSDSGIGRWRSSDGEWATNPASVNKGRSRDEIASVRETPRINLPTLPGHRSTTGSDRLRGAFIRARRGAHNIARDI